MTSTTTTIGAPAPLRAGVVGAGVFGRFHALKYASLPGADLIAIADPDASAAGRVAAETGADPLSDPHDLIGRVDVVSVASPASTHAPLTAAFLEAGLHVLVEKPIAETLDEADRLVALARQQKRVLQVGHQERFVLADFGLARREIAPLSIEAVRRGPFSGRGMDVSVVLDLMIHDIDMVHSLAPGEVAELTARARTEHGEHADEVRAAFRLSSGTQVTLEASRLADAKERHMRIVYPDGEVTLDFMTRRLSNSTPLALKAAFGGEGDEGAVANDPLGAAIGAFLDAVARGGVSPISGEAGRRALATARLVEAAARQSAKAAPALAVSSP